MIRKDRELLAEVYRLKCCVGLTRLRIMDGRAASAAGQMDKGAARRIR